MLNISENMTLREVTDQSPFFQECSRWLIRDWGGEQVVAPIKDLPFGSGLATIEGMKALQRLHDEGHKVLHDYYTEEEKAACPELEQTKMFHFPGESGAPFVVICPGGAYMDVSVYNEGFQTAMAFQRAGYHAFIVHFRTDYIPLMPRPMDDLSRAITYILAHAEELGTVTKDYAVQGYSSGGHLAASWGTDNHGYRVYQQPKPAALILGYPAGSMNNFCDDISAGLGTTMYREVGNQFLTRIGGRGYTKESLKEYSIEEHIDEAYPPTYLVHSKDDSGVHFQGSLYIEESLKAHHIPYEFDKVDGCDHGFALGEGSPAEGWIDHAIAFWEKQMKAN